jgi:hypothetical protein
MEFIELEMILRLVVRFSHRELRDGLSLTRKQILGDFRSD